MNSGLELLAPAGDWQCARAAVENGADAIYFGMDQFNARMRAPNFTLATLPPLLDFLRRRGVRGYVTLNTLVWPDELAEAERYVRALIAARVDAAIVQDVGLCRLIRRLSPDFPIHASTQMTVTTAAGVDFARRLGCSQVTLARECSIAEIDKIKKDPLIAAEPGASEVVLEVFIHGALCISYSGQCLASGAFGGRSANRGECAQPCRLPYGLVCDGKPVALEDREYLLSPQDLAGLELLPDLIAAGVRSFKIEGRLKTPEYVANITHLYRTAIDLLETSSRDGFAEFCAQAQYAMEMAFSRGLHTGWLRGVNHQTLVHGRFSKKRGLFLGRVRAVQGSAVLLRLEAPLKPGDGVVFDAGHPEQEEEGGRVYSVERRDKEVSLTFGRGDLDLRRVHPGDRLWKTHDPELERRLRRSFDGPQPQFQNPIDVVIAGQAGQPMMVRARDKLGHTAQAVSGIPLESAHSQPFTVARLRTQFGRLGGTPFRLGGLENQLVGAVILPVKELNRLRRELVRQLALERARPRPWQLTAEVPAVENHSVILDLAPGDAEARSARFNRVETQAARGIEVAVLVRSLDQLDAVLRRGVSILYCDLADPREFKAAVQLVHSVRDARPDPAGEPRLYAALPRMAKPGEEWMLRQVRAGGADGYLVRNFDQLRSFGGEHCIGDFSLNVANPSSAGYFIGQCGLERVTASYDMELDRIEALLRNAPPAWFEVTVYRHTPLFHLEHCLFCARLSSATGPDHCGRPCDKHRMRLLDARTGAPHEVRADAGCRNTVFRAQPQNDTGWVAPLRKAGLRVFRLELLDETPLEAARIVTEYHRLLSWDRA